MSGFGTPILEPLPAAVTHVEVEATDFNHADDEIKHALLDITTDLLAVQGMTALLGTNDPDPSSPSLRTIHARLNAGVLSISGTGAHTSAEERVDTQLGKRSPRAAHTRPLEDFEDLYYAMLAKIQEMHQSLAMRLNNGFNSFDDFIVDDTMTIQNFHSWLLDQWQLLNRASLAKTMDNAIRRSRTKLLHQDLLTQLQAGALTQDDTNELIAELYDPENYSTVQGLHWLGEWSPAMINAWLAEKYHTIFTSEKEQAKKKERWDKKKAHLQKITEKDGKAQLQQEKDSQQRQMQNETEQRHCEIQFEVERQQHAIAQQQAQEAQWMEQEQEQMDTDTVHQRVAIYGQFLRDRASDNARWMVHQTRSNAHQNFYDAQCQVAEEKEGEDKDVEIEIGYIQY